MKWLRCSILTLITWGVLLAPAVAAPTLKFEFQQIQIPGEPSDNVSDISNTGTMVGIYTDSNGAIHGYKLTSEGKLTTLDGPNAVLTRARGISPKGTRIVGLYKDTSGVVHGFLFKGGKFHEVAPPGTTFTIACGVNDAGNIAGTFVDASNNQHGFWWDGSKFTQLDVAGATYTVAWGINNGGTITLQWGDAAGNIHSSLYVGGKYKKLPDVPGSTSSVAEQINTAGDIAYTWIDTSGLVHGAVRKAGKFYKFDYPGGQNTNSNGINDKNVVTGEYFDQNGVVQGFTASY